MALIRIETLRSLLVLTYLVIISLVGGYANGSQIFTVGDGHGWLVAPENGTLYDFQAWASSKNVCVDDALDFGFQNPQTNVLRVTLEAERSCDAFDGAPVRADISSNRIIYHFTFPGQFGFICSLDDYCETLNMSFVINVTNPPGPAPSIDWEDIGVTQKKHGKHVGWVIGVVTGTAVLLVLLILLFSTRRTYWHKVTKSRGLFVQGVSQLGLSSDSTRSQGTEEGIGEVEWPWGPQRFYFKELKEATNNFSSSQVIGEGGFGTVYKGILRHSPGSLVAVKRLSQWARQGAREFMAEVNIISHLRHRNLVQLLGWCDENEELILVYEYMSNGDLDDRIFGNYYGDAQECTPLAWEHRYSIFCGVATALVYLHEEWEQRVVHRDVKTSNVMLDSQFNARLGDFGLARLSAHSQAPRTTLVAGTIGYLAPEFNLTGKATDKTDVYAFGIVILEVCCARRPLTSNCILVDWVWELHGEEKLLDAIDPKLDLKTTSAEEEMKRALQLGLLCCHPDPSSRPTMRHVLNILTGETPLTKMPRSKPVAFFAEVG